MADENFAIASALAASSVSKLDNNCNVLSVANAVAG